jgi:branched-chain amino acid transport system permease protein
MTTFVQLLVYGVQLGSIYALLAIGYTMVFGIIRMINLAHGDFLMIGCYSIFFIVNLFFANFMIGPAIAVLVIMVGATITGSIGVGVERIAYKPLRNRPKISSMIAAMGVSLFTQNLFRSLPFIGPNPKTFPMLFPDITFFVGPIQLSSMRVVTILFSIVIMAALYFLDKNTKVGMNIRAVACDKDAASLMGININSIISLTFFIGAALAAISGAFYASSYPVLMVTMGSPLGNKAFISAVVGGIGDIRGAMLGGIIMGILEILISSVNSSIAYGFSFVVLVAILLLKPEGLFGKPVIEKV